MKFLEWLRSDIQPEVFGGVPRSPRWGAFRDHYLQGKTCAACNTKEELEAHHIVPFHIDKSLEMSGANLVALCRNHHLTFGHCGDWSAFNPQVLADSAAYLRRFKEVRGKP